MKKFVKDINGKRVYKTRSQIVIQHNGMNTYNPTEEMILLDGWNEYIEQLHEITLEETILRKLEELENYDKSNDVNGFYVKGMFMWLDKATRAGLMLRFNAELESGKTETSLWYNGIEFPLNLEDAVKMLYAIEIYASLCYDNTQKHIAEIKKLTTKEDIENYNFKVNYPDKLSF